MRCVLKSCFCFAIAIALSMFASSIDGGMVALAADGTPASRTQTTEPAAGLPESAADRMQNGKSGGEQASGPPSVADLILAIRRKDLTAVTSLLTDGVDPNAVPEHGRLPPIPEGRLLQDARQLQPMHEAVVAGDEAIVSALLEAGADVGQGAYHYPQGPLDLAQERGHAPIVALIEAEREASAQFVIEVRRGDLGRVREMVDRGAHLDARVDHFGPDGGTPLIAALGERSAPMVKLLLDAGANPNWDVVNISSAPYRFVPLHVAIRIAVQEGDRQFMHMLLEAGADPDSTIYDNGDVELQLGSLAVAIGPGDRNTEAVRDLIRWGADPDSKHCYFGGHCRDWTNLGLAAAHGNAELVRLFVAAGNPLTRGEETAWSGSPNPVMEAAKYGHVEVLTIFRDEFGVDLAAKDYFGCTTLDYAIAADRPATAEFLREAGVELTESGCRPEYIERHPP